MPVLVNMKGQTVFHINHETVLGRHYECNCILPVAQISRYHCRFEFIKDEWYITDLESTNGTFLAGKQLLPNTPYLLENSDFLTFGRVAHLRFIRD